MRVAWVTLGGVVKDSAGNWTSYFASTRYRVLIPARELLHEGLNSRVISLGKDEDILEREQDFPRDCDVLVISKNFNPGVVQWVERFQALGRPVVVDLCDDHFDGEPGDLHRRLVSLADEVVANTEFMAQRIEAVCGRSAVVIPDPYEGERKPPRFAPSRDCLKLLWFGSDTQLATLGDYLPRLLNGLRYRGVSLPIHLEIVTRETPNLRKNIATLSHKYAPQVVSNLTPWGLGVTEAVLARCDAVIIPSRDEARFQVKSANRLLLSLWNGRFVAAWPLPEYRQFSAWSYVGDDLAEGLGWALAHPETVEKDIRAAQDYIADRFSPRRIGEAWLKCLSQVKPRGKEQKSTESRKKEDDPVGQGG